MFLRFEPWSFIGYCPEMQKKFAFLEDQFKSIAGEMYGAVYLLLLLPCTKWCFCHDRFIFWLLSLGVTTESSTCYHLHILVYCIHEPPPNCLHTLTSSPIFVVLDCPSSLPWLWFTQMHILVTGWTCSLIQYLFKEDSTRGHTRQPQNAQLLCLQKKKKRGKNVHN